MFNKGEPGKNSNIFLAECFQYFKDTVSLNYYPDETDALMLVMFDEWLGIIIDNIVVLTEDFEKNAPHKRVLPGENCLIDDRWECRIRYWKLVLGFVMDLIGKTDTEKADLYWGIIQHPS